VQKITPFLWFNNEAETAMKFYVSVFKDSKITHITPGADGKVMWVSAEIAGLTFYALNGGPDHPFTDAISLFVDCKDQSEVDELWGKLTADGGQEGNCGWLKDKYNLSWQIIPKALSEYLANDKTGKVMQAMLTMKKINVAELKQAQNLL
jgi:predicted 3-demethylubiquinone-9 3-methyltransferase (glyoxalase superfamily)